MRAPNRHVEQGARPPLRFIAPAPPRIEQLSRLSGLPSSAPAVLREHVERKTRRHRHVGMEQTLHLATQASIPTGRPPYHATRYARTGRGRHSQRSATYPPQPLRVEGMLQYDDAVPPRAPRAQAPASRRCPAHSQECRTLTRPDSGWGFDNSSPGSRAGPGRTRGSARSEEGRGASSFGIRMRFHMKNFLIVIRKLPRVLLRICQEAGGRDSSRTRRTGLRADEATYEWPGQRCDSERRLVRETRRRSRTWAPTGRRPTCPAGAATSARSTACQRRRRPVATTFPVERVGPLLPGEAIGVGATTPEGVAVRRTGRRARTFEIVSPAASNRTTDSEPHGSRGCAVTPALAPAYRTTRPQGDNPHVFTTGSTTGKYRHPGAKTEPYHDRSTIDRPAILTRSCSSSRHRIELKDPPSFGEFRSQGTTALASRVIPTIPIPISRPPAIAPASAPRSTPLPVMSQPSFDDATICVWLRRDGKYARSSSS